MQDLIRGVHGANRDSMRVRDAIRLIENLNSSRQRMFQNLLSTRTNYEDDLMEENPDL